MTARWAPGRLSGFDTRTLTWVLVAMATLRTLDYSTGADVDSPTLTAVEQAAPLWVWAILTGVGALILAGGALARIHFAVWLGYVWLATTYVGLLAGVLMTSLETPWFDGIRSAGLVIGILAIHSLLALRTGPTPIQRDESHAIETTVSDSGNITGA